MRLIDADEAYRKVLNQGMEHPNARVLTRYAELILSEAQTVDAAPVTHGHWIPIKKDLCIDVVQCTMCSACNATFVGGVIYAKNFCPNCGARMEEERDDD